MGVILIHVPSLNERKDDIPTLAKHFLQQICSEYGMPQKEFAPDALKALQTIDWTGNIRELRNVVERLIILCDKKISAADVTMYVKAHKA